MIVAFQLSMPGCGSWNGKWSGEDQLYINFRTLSKSTVEKLFDGDKEKIFSYSWDDGWRASIKMTQSNSAEKKSLSKKSAGFAGYEWMIDSILTNGYIKAE